MSGSWASLLVCASAVHNIIYSVLLSVSTTKHEGVMITVGRFVYN